MARFARRAAIAAARALAYLLAFIAIMGTGFVVCAWAAHGAVAVIRMIP